MRAVICAVMMPPQHLDRLNPIKTNRQKWALPLSAAVHVLLLGGFLLAHFPDPAETEPAAVEITISSSEELPEPQPQPMQTPVPQIQPVVSHQPKPVTHAAIKASSPAPSETVATPAQDGPPADAPQTATTPSQVMAAPAAAVVAKPLSDPLALYAGKVRMLLERHKRYPSEARYDGVEGVVYLKFRLDKSGTLLDWAITASSGSASLDEEAIHMLHLAAPFPEIPEDVGRDRLELVVPVAFSLGKSDPG